MGVKFWKSVNFSLQFPKKIKIGTWQKMNNYHENLKVKEGDVLIHKKTGDKAKVTSFDKNEDMVNVLINNETYDSWPCEHLQNSFIYGEMFRKSDGKDTELVKHF